jgi:hypothetical protein
LTAAHFIRKYKWLSEKNILEVFCTDAQFRGTVPNFTHFSDGLEFEDETGFKGSN